MSPNYHKVAGEEHLQGTVSGVTVEKSQASGPRDIL